MFYFWWNTGLPNDKNNYKKKSYKYPSLFHHPEVCILVKLLDCRSKRYWKTLRYFDIVISIFNKTEFYFYNKI